MVSNDPGVVRDVVLGVAHWHGRVLVLDRDSAAESTGHGSPRALSAVTGTWVPGAPRTTPARHPFQLSLAELEVGMSVQAGPRTITLQDVDAFAELSGDRFYAHTDEAAAAANPFFEGRVAHGYFLVSMAAGLFVEPSPGPVLANYGLEHLRFLTPVYPGDDVRVELTGPAGQIAALDRLLGAGAPVPSPDAP